jgi:hypothetical protein
LLVRHHVTEVFHLFFRTKMSFKIRCL